MHIIINNAGILRDSSIKKMTEKDFKLVIDVHLNGAYAVTKAAWPYFQNKSLVELSTLPLQLVYTVTLVKLTILLPNLLC